MNKFLADGISARVADELKKVGYAHVTLDLQGYRRGSMRTNRCPRPKPPHSSHTLDRQFSTRPGFALLAS